MKAIIFAAGLGTRLRPLTNDRPKALVEVGGVAMLEHVIKRLINHGIDEIVINIHHFGDKIIEFIKFIIIQYEQAKYNTYSSIIPFMIHHLRSHPARSTHESMSTCLFHRPFHYMSNSQIS